MCKSIRDQLKGYTPFITRDVTGLFDSWALFKIDFELFVQGFIT